MATSRSLDCSLDQLIDQGETGRSGQRRREFVSTPTSAAPKRPTRRLVDASLEPAEAQPRGALHQAVRKQAMKKQAPVKQPSNNFVSKLTPVEAAVHVSTVRREPNGDVVVSFKNTDVLTATAATGDLILNSGGYRTFSTRAVLCAALQPIGLKVDGDANKPDDEECNDNWAVSDGRAFLQKFEDGMTVQQIGRLTRHQLLARPSVILQFMQQKKAGLAKKAGRSLRPVQGALQRSQEMQQDNRTMLQAAVED